MVAILSKYVDNIRNTVSMLPQYFFSSIMPCTQWDQWGEEEEDRQCSGSGLWLTFGSNEEMLTKARKEILKRYSGPWDLPEIRREEHRRRDHLHWWMSQAICGLLGLENVLKEWIGVHGSKCDSLHDHG